MAFPTFASSATMSAWYKKAKPFLWASGIFIACLVCAVLVWFQYLSNSSALTEDFLLNDAYTTTTAPMQEGVSTTQTFETNSAIYEVGVYFERLSPTVAGKLHVQLIETGSGTVLLDTIGNIESVYYDSYTAFALPAPANPTMQLLTYQLVITPTYTAEANTLALKKSETTPTNFSNLTENGTSAEGALALKVTYDQLGGLTTRNYFILCVFFAVCAASIYLLCFLPVPKRTTSKRLQLSPSVLAFVMIFTVGLFYQFALPAFSTPDEQSHYDTAYGISNTWLGLAPTTEGATLVKRSTDAQNRYATYRTNAFTYDYIAEHFWDAPDGTYVEESPVLLGPYDLPYYISAVGLTIGQLLGWGGIATTFFARCLNLLFFAGMASIAMRITPFGKGIFAAIALLPISLHVGGSFSYDSCLLALSFVTLALGLRLAYQEENINWWEVTTFAILCFLIAPLKLAYFPLALLALLIPLKRFDKTWQGYLCKLGIPLLSVLHFYVRHFIIVAVQVNVSSDLDAIALEEASTAVYTVSTLLAYPMVAFRMIVNTFFTNFSDYLISMLGGTLGYQDLSEVNLNILFVFAFAMLLLFASISSKQRNPIAMPVWHRLTLGTIFLAVLGILVIACFSWTLITYPTLWGFQGRYLLPVLGCVVFALRPSGIYTQKDCFLETVYVGFLLNGLVLLNVVAIIFNR